MPYNGRRKNQPLPDNLKLRGVQKEVRRERKRKGKKISLKKKASKESKGEEKKKKIKPSGPVHGSYKKGRTGILQ